MKIFMTIVLSAFLLDLDLGAKPSRSQDTKSAAERAILYIPEKIQQVPNKMKPGFDSITAGDSLALLSFLSSDLMEGRETATRGYQIAAEYAASLFSLWHLKPGGDLLGQAGPERETRGVRGGQPSPGERRFRQEFVLREISEILRQISLKIETRHLLRTLVFQPQIDFKISWPPTTETLEAPVVFAGYGITEKELGYDDFRNLDVGGKIVLLISEAPGKDNPRSPFQQKGIKEKYFAPAKSSSQDGEVFSKTLEVFKRGAVAVLQAGNSNKDADFHKGIIRSGGIPDDRPIWNSRRWKYLLLPGGGPELPWEASSRVIAVSTEMANAILEGIGETIEDLRNTIETTGKPASKELPGTRLTIAAAAKSSPARGMNILGWLEGSDPELKSEVVMIGAHLDGLGIDGDYVYNSANDNGSGAVAVLNAAKAFALNPERPKRSIVFCLWDGEEKYLRGSRYYIMNPTFPLDKTIAYLNLDMVGWPFDESRMAALFLGDDDPQHQEAAKKINPANLIRVSLAAGSADLGDIIRNASRFAGLDLFLQESDGTQEDSDQRPFASARIPWVSYLASAREDYHQTSDSVEKVSGTLLERISRQVYLTAYALADK